MLELFLLLFKITPAIIIHLILLLGILGFFISFFIPRYIPGIAAKQKIIKYISGFMIVLGIYFEGGLAVTRDYERKLIEWEAKVQIAENQSKVSNEKLQETLEKALEDSKKNTVIIQERIREVAPIIDRECKVPPEAIQLLNEAARTRK